MSRPTGSKNKVTLQTRKLLQNIVEKNITKIETELDLLNGKQYMDSIIKLVEFLIPKAKESEEIQEVPQLSIHLTGLHKHDISNQNTINK